MNHNDQPLRYNAICTICGCAKPSSLGVAIGTGFCRCVTSDAELRRKVDEVVARGAFVPVAPPTPVLTPEQFAMWLRGFAEGGGTDFKAVMRVLSGVVIK